MSIETLHTDWKVELNKVAYKYHVLVLWVALILNPIWAIGDYFTIPVHFVDFFAFRMAVSVACVITLIYRDRFTDKPWVLAFIPFMGIAIQNGFMYSVMEVPELEKHTFAFIALFIGAGMFVLWEPIYSVLVNIATFIFTIIFFIAWSPLTVSEILINGGMLTGTVALFTILLINTRTNLTKKEIISRLALAESNKKLAIQNSIIEEKNKDIQDSIKYAQRIQHAILPHDEDISVAFEDHFVLYKPKDIIAGDFYWFENLSAVSIDANHNSNKSTNQQILIAAADCTGHGVPGAMVSVVCSNALNRTVLEYGITEPGKILDKVRELVIEAFENKDSKVQDGMDISLCGLELNQSDGPSSALNGVGYATLRWSGANNPLWIIRNGEIISFKPDKQPIGYYAESKPFTTHTIEVQKGDQLYLFTDGIQDQFGGKDGKKFKATSLQKLLLSIAHLPMSRQKEEVNETIEKWRGSLEQIDDICLIGIKI